MVCGCGNNLEVPSLRAIRELTPHSQVSDVDKYQWNPAAGMTFASGVIIALVGAGMALYMHLYATELSTFEAPPKEQIEAWVAEIEKAQPEELIDAWNTFRHDGLGEYQMSPLIQARIDMKWAEMTRNIGMIVVACGLAFAGSSIFLRSRSG